MRLLAIITDLKKYIEKAQTDKVMRRRVKGNCHFDTMVVFLSGSKSDLTAAKLHFFVAVAKPLEEFLTLFQAEEPLMPFLSDEMHSILKTIAQRFIRPSVIPKETIKMKDTDFQNQDNHLAFPAVDISIAAKSKMSAITASDSNLQKFVTLCVDGLVTLTTDLVKKFPLQLLVVRDARCFSPVRIIEEPEGSIKECERLLKHFFEKNRISSEEGDKAFTEYKELVTVTAVENRMKFTDFCKEKDRLDCFLAEFIPKETSLFTVFTMIMVLFHSNASVE